MKLRLRDTKGGIFYDPATGLRLDHDKVVVVSSIRGKLTQDWLNSGGIVIVKDEDTNSLSFSAMEKEEKQADPVNDIPTTEDPPKFSDAFKMGPPPSKPQVKRGRGRPRK